MQFIASKLEVDLKNTLTGEIDIMVEEQVSQ